MKIKSFFTLVFVCLSFTLIAQYVPTSDYEDSKEDKYEYFVELASGKIIKFNESLKVKTIGHAERCLVGDGVRLPYTVDSVKAFQTEKVYFLRVVDSAKLIIGPKPFIMYYAGRLRKGKIDIYALSQEAVNSWGGPLMMPTFYLKKGKTGSVQPVTKETIAEAIKDRKDIEPKYGLLFSTRIKAILKIIDEYN